MTPAAQGAPARRRSGGGVLGPGELTALQRKVGNRGATRALARRELPVIDDIHVPAGMRGNAEHPEEHWRYEHRRHAGPLAVRGAGEDVTGLAADDIVQGAVGDCFFLSPLMAFTRISPSRVRRRINGPVGRTRAGNNVYEVYFWHGDAWRTYRVDDRFVTYQNGRPVYAQYGDISAVGPEIWVMVMEKAWAALRGGSFDQTHFGMIDDAYRALMNSGTDWYFPATMTDERLLQVIQDAVIAGKLICPGTMRTEDMSQAARDRERALGKVITPSHAYNISGCHTGTRTIDIANPHGINHLPNLHVNDFRLWFRQIAISKDSAR